MDFNIEVRRKQLQSLDQYITSSKDKVQSILDYLGWNSKNIVESEIAVSCSINPHHKISTASMQEHLKKCYLKTAGYNMNDTFLSEPFHDSSDSIKLDNAKKIEILGEARHNNQKFKAAWNGQDSDPMTADRLFSTFSTDERLILYDYCVKNTEPPPAPSEFNINIDEKKEEKLLTQEELLAKERDAKRRRTKYKAVHTSRNKSYTEVVKEVIENQMELYREYLTPNVESDISSSNVIQSSEQDPGNGCSYNDVVEYRERFEDIERPHSSVSQHSTHSGGSRCKRDSNSYEFHKNEDEQKPKYPEYDKKHRYDGKYDYSPYKEKERRYRKHKDDSRYYSKDKRNWHYKSDRRH